MKIELGRDEIAIAIEEYVKTKINNTLFTTIEVTQAKSAKATVTISEPKDQEDAG